VAGSWGLVYFTDTTSDLVYRFDPNNVVGSFSSFGGFGSGSGQLDYPEDVAVDGLDDVFVAAANNNPRAVWNPV
jgi:hypothetical protein